MWTRPRARYALVSTLETQSTPVSAKRALYCAVVCGICLIGLLFFAVSFPSFLSYSAHTSSPPKILLVAIMSAPENINRRDTIRDTWMHYRSITGVTIKFFIGQVRDASLTRELKEESESQNDIVPLDMWENYYNLSRKSLEVVKYATDHGFEGMVKVDDDSLLRVDELVKQLRELGDTRFVLLGQWWRDAPVIREPSHKYYMGDQFPDQAVFPPYPSGCTYYLGREILKLVANLKNPFLYRMEDVAMGLWTLGSKRLEVEFELQRCSDANMFTRNGIVISVVQIESRSQHHNFWYNVQRFGSPCENQIREVWWKDFLRKFSFR